MNLLHAIHNEGISEVALLCGYYDPDYFCRLFRARAGMSSTAYQKKHCAR